MKRFRCKPAFLLRALVCALLVCSACSEDLNTATSGGAGKDDGVYRGMAPSGNRVGEMLAISSHMSKSTEASWTRDFEIEKLAGAGVGLLRTDFSWKRIEPKDDQWQLEGYDMMVDLCLQAGIHINALLDYGVDWARTDGTDNGIDPAVWADFNGHVAAHFADRIDVYEVWNEQNTQRFWKPYPNPEHYGRLLKAGYEAIHASDPTARVLFGGLSSMDIFMFGPHGLWNFLVHTAEEHPDLCEWFDGLAIHPYTFLQQTMPEMDVTIGDWTYPDLPQAVDHARAILSEIGCPDKPIHFTEVGWPDLLIGTERQAAYLARSLVLAASKGVETYYWYTFWDGRGDAFPPTEDAFGLFTWPGEEPEEKSCSRALSAANRILGNARYAGDLGRTLDWEEAVHGQVFADNAGLWTLALWHGAPDLTEAVPMVVPLHPRAVETWELYDQEGDLLRQGSAREGKVEIALTGRVQYLRFGLSDAK